MTFGWDPMRTSAVFAMCKCASPEVGGFQGGHGKVGVLFTVVHTWCRNTPLPCPTLVRLHFIIGTNVLSRPVHVPLRLNTVIQGVLAFFLLFA